MSLDALKTQAAKTHQGCNLQKYSKTEIHGNGPWTLQPPLELCVVAEMS